MPQRTATAPVVMFQSASLDHSGRIGFTAQMMEHIKVHSYGRILNNRTLSGPDLRRLTKHQTIAAYPFCLAFENSITTDYVTEKIYDCLLAGTVPIYLGTPDVAEFVPEGSYIDATAHGGPRGLAAYLKHLLERPEEYASYLAWRDKPLPAALVAMTESVSVDHFLRLLDRLPPRPDALHVIVNLPTNPSMTEMRDRCNDTPPETANSDSTAQAILAKYSPEPGPLGSLDVLARLLRVIAFASHLTPLRTRLVKAAMVAAVWLVGLIFLNAGWPTPLFAATATVAWLAGARWIQHVGAAAVVVAILVRIGALPPPADWRALILSSHAPVRTAR